MRQSIFRRLAAVFCAAAFFALCGAAEAAAPAVQITLYDLAAAGRNPVATGRAILSPSEQRAKMYVFSAQPGVAKLPYGRDSFFVTRVEQDVQTGAVRFRVRYEQIIDKRCTAMEIREYAGVRIGDSCELYSARGNIRAVMKLI